MATERKPKKAQTTKEPAAAKKVTKKKAPTKKPVAGAKKPATKKPKKQAILRIQYYRSAIGFSKEQKRVVKGLGFGRLNAIRELQDTPAVRGMVRKVPHLVRVVE